MTDRIDQALDADLTHVTSEIARADQKAALLAGLAGAALAVVGGAATDYSLPLAAQIIGGLGVAALLAAIFMLLQVVLPDTGGSTPVGWPRWATCTPDEVLDGLRQEQRAERLCAMSRIAARKMRGIRPAVHCLRGGVSLLALAALTARVLS